MQLEAGLVQLWLAKGDLAAADVTARRLLERLLATVEGTWQGLAWELSARVALANGNYDRAELHLERNFNDTGPRGASGGLEGARHPSGNLRTPFKIGKYLVPIETPAASRLPAYLDRSRITSRCSTLFFPHRQLRHL
jgi:hypothetical protein